MFRFKTSKYKNSTAKVPKKEGWITDIAVGSPQSYGNHIQASSAFMAFNLEARGGGSLAVLPLDYKGRKSRDMPLLHCHAELVTDFSFSPFNDGLLATGSQDCAIKVWNIPKAGLNESLSNPEMVLPEQERRIENVLFHPAVELLLATSSFTTVKLWDLQKGSEIYSFGGHEELVQSISWQGSGGLLVSSSKDKKLRVLDPRANSISQEVSIIGNPKDSRVLWLGDTNRILNTGFDSSHHRHVTIRDVRNFKQCMKSLTIDTAMGVLIPLFDPDTNMLFLSGKADSSITFMEVSDTEPYLSEASKQICEFPTKGACIIPKRAVNAMNGEVNRLLQLTQTAVIPITYQVPRKTYRDFHADLFPDTLGAEPAIDICEWISGSDKKPAKVSLDPAKRSCPNLQCHRQQLSIRRNNNIHSDYEKIEAAKADMYRQGKDKNVQNIPDAGVANNEKNSKPAEDKKSIAKIAEPEGLSWESPSIPSTRPKPAVSPKPVRGKIVERHSLEDTGRGVISLEDNKAIPVPVPAPRRGSVGSVPIPALRRSSLTAGPAPNPRSGAKDVVDRATPVAAVAGGDTVADVEAKLGSSPKSKWIRESEGPKNSWANKEAPVDNHIRLSSSPRSSWIRDTSGSSEDDMVLGSSPKSAMDSKAKPAGKSKPLKGFRVSKFRHLKGTHLHKRFNIENIRNLSTSMPGECDGFSGNKDRVVVPLKGPGGRLAVFELSKPGRLPDGVLPVLQNGTNVMDFAWDPFNTRKLAIGCDDGSIRLWFIPEGGLHISQEEPADILTGHTEKIYFIKFHHLAKDVLASGSYDMTVRIWNLVTKEAPLSMEGHTDQIFCFAWSPDGQQFATVCKDCKVRIYEPRTSNKPIREGPGPLGSRGARVTWILNGKYLAVSGFDKVSERQITIYDSSDLSSPLTTLGIDVSPAILVPYYDEDSCTLFITGKGDSTIFAYEMLEESPYLFPLSHHKCPNVHQALCFLPKSVCIIKDVEFSRVLRLTSGSVEPISFTVPRVKKEFFQDDIFPDTRVLWEPTMTCEEWFSGVKREAKRISLQPPGMMLLSGNSTTNTGPTVNPVIGNLDLIKSDKKKEQEV